MRQFAVLAIATALPFAAFAQSDFNWSGSLSPGQTLEIKGINGSIRAELAPGNVIEVSARKTAHRSDPSSVRIEVVPSADGVTIGFVADEIESQPVILRGSFIVKDVGGAVVGGDDDVDAAIIVDVTDGEAAAKPALLEDRAGLRRDVHEGGAGVAEEKHRLLVAEVGIIDLDGVEIVALRDD